ncbi:hypothetical protein P4T88_21220, partial [Bacillus licheniformis]|nr:hypothetical protein [Bacillus licheniformis]
IKLPVPTGIQGTGSIGVFSKSHFNGSVQMIGDRFFFILSIQPDTYPQVPSALGRELLSLLPWLGF